MKRTGTTNYQEKTDSEKRVMFHIESKFYYIRCTNILCFVYEIHQEVSCQYQLTQTGCTIRMITILILKSLNISLRRKILFNRRYVLPIFIHVYLIPQHAQTICSTIVFETEVKELATFTRLFYFFILQWAFYYTNKVWQITQSRICIVA